jgi:recombination protein RecT
MTTTQNGQVAQIQKNISDQVLAKIETFKASGELKLPADYSPENALKAAYLTLLETKDKNGQAALQVCSKESVANALLKMVVWGLSPLKKQCDFIVRGTQLTCDPEYTGNILLAKRYGGLKHHKANAIFKGDDFKFEVGLDGRRKLIHHKQELESIGGEVTGAYVTYELEDGTQDMEIMNIVQIRNAWNQGQMKGQSGAHKNFSDQMAIKTVYNRMCKLLIRASDDAVLMGDGGSDDDEVKQAPAVAEARQEVIDKANAQEISFEDTPSDQPSSDMGIPISEDNQRVAPQPQPERTNSQTEIPY